jgi:NAD(P)H-hydrate epimerase
MQAGQVSEAASGTFRSPWDLLGSMTTDVKKRELESPLRFLLDDDVEVPNVSSDEMREIDRIAVEETGPALLQIMENAGRALAAVAIEQLGTRWPTAEIVVLAGGGGNGGGGICAARHLANHGGRVRLVLSSPNTLGEAPAIQRRIFAMTSGVETPWDQVERLRPALVLDALIGYGLSAAPTGVAADAISWANDARERGASVISLDAPSGLDATTGAVPGRRVHADVTVTLALPKTGLQPAYTGDLILADLGIPERAIRRVVANYRSPFDGRWWRALHVAPAAPLT